MDEIKDQVIDKKPARFSRKLIIALVLVFVVAGAGGALASGHKAKASTNYDTPGDVGITVKDQSMTGLSQVKQMIAPINGTVTDNFSSIGEYWIKVKPGTENSAIRYLDSLPDVKSAIRNHCCTVLPS